MKNDIRFALGLMMVLNVSVNLLQAKSNVYLDIMHQMQVASKSVVVNTIPYVKSGFTYAVSDKGYKEISNTLYLLGKIYVAYHIAKFLIMPINKESNSECECEVVLPNDKKDKKPWTDVIGNEEAVINLQQKIKVLTNPTITAELKKRGIDTKGVILAGPPGTGKTLMAKVFADQANLPLLAISAPAFKDELYGGSEKKVRDLFAQAGKLAKKYGGCTIFIDEFDVIAGKTDGDIFQDQVTSSVTKQFLDQLDGFKDKEYPIFVLAATNIPELLDAAVTRPGRFNDIITVDYPNEAGILQLIRLYITKLQVDTLFAPEDINALGSQLIGWSPAAIEALLQESVKIAILEEKINKKFIEQKVRERILQYKASKGLEKKDEESKSESLWSFRNLFAQGASSRVHQSSGISAKQSKAKRIGQRLRVGSFLGL